MQPNLLKIGHRSLIRVNYNGLFNKITKPYKKQFKTNSTILNA